MPIYSDVDTGSQGPRGDTGATGPKGDKGYCASTEDENARVAIYVNGADVDDQQLRDLITKGVLHIVTGL